MRLFFTVLLLIGSGVIVWSQVENGIVFSKAFFANDALNSRYRVACEALFVAA